MTTQRDAGSQPDSPKPAKPIKTARRRPMVDIDAKNAQHLWQIIEWRRKDIGLSVRGLARHAQISPIRLSRYLRGTVELGSNNIDVLLFSLGLRLTVEPGFVFHKRPAPTRLPRNVAGEPMTDADVTHQNPQNRRDDPAEQRGSGS